MSNVVQLKLSSGDEIICEVMEWPDPNGNEMIIRNAMTMTYSFDVDNEQMFGLRPWFTMVENENEYIIINVNHVTGTARPSATYFKEYRSALNHMHEMGKKRSLNMIKNSFVKRKDSWMHWRKSLQKYPMKIMHH